MNKQTSIAFQLAMIAAVGSVVTHSYDYKDLSQRLATASASIAVTAVWMSAAETED